MIKFSANSDKGPLFGFGLSQVNVDMLKEGKPIAINMEDLGGPRMTIVLMYGETEGLIVKELQKHGMLPSKIDVFTNPDEIRVVRNLDLRSPGNTEV